MHSGWEALGLTTSDLVIIALMVLVFTLAVALPYPQKQEENRR
jgi:hypothetical protein